MDLPLDLLAALIVLRLLVHFVDRGRLRTLAGAGVIYGLAVFCKQDYGAAALLG